MWSTTKNIKTMSKIIYRKVRTAPGLKLTDANWNANAAYYAKAVSLETLSQRDMARHISSHGSPYTVDVVMGVLEAYRNCLIEQLLESKKVKVDGLGTFYVTIANKEGGEKDITKFNISNIAQGLRLRFLPDASQEENLSSKEFLKKASFIDVSTLTKDNTVEDEESDNDNDGDNENDTENQNDTENESQNPGTTNGGNENGNENENTGGNSGGGGDEG
jgi:predicted histone-like DNA-binding protein